MAIFQIGDRIVVTGAWSGYNIGKTGQIVACLTGKITGRDYYQVRYPDGVMWHGAVTKTSIKVRFEGEYNDVWIDQRDIVHA